MSFSVLYSRACVGIHAPLVTVEVHITGGLPRVNIVGLPETVVKESKDRVKSAIQMSGFEFPMRRVTINLAPADLPKEGGRFDLPIALGILIASRQLPIQTINDYEFAGELALSGELRPIRGSLSLALSVKKSNRTLILPKANVKEACFAEGASVMGANHLLDVCQHLRGQELLPLEKTHHTFQRPNYNDISDVKGQHQARRVLEIAASAGHSVLFVGPPGSGKTLLANRLLSILPHLTQDEASDSAAVQSISHQGFNPDDWQKRPFRSPHHSASSVALVGGSNPPKPGEISLAHNGILFLDELPEFQSKVLEALREPLESGEIVISRAARQATYPARFQFMAAMNPCPCGYLGDGLGLCHCTPDQIQRYQKKLSGPLLDRIDMHITVGRMKVKTLIEENTDVIEDSETVRTRVVAARKIQWERQGKLNNQLIQSDIALYCAVDKKTQQSIEEILERLNISARAYHRLLKVSRTIADMQEAKNISKKHIFEAVNYRRVFFQSTA